MKALNYRLWVYNISHHVYLRGILFLIGFLVLNVTDGMQAGRLMWKRFYFLSSLFEHIPGQCSHFIPPENTKEHQKTTGFLVFTGGIKWEHSLLAAFTISFKINFSVANFPILHLL